jgi:hypothetical protein
MVIFIVLPLWVWAFFEVRAYSEQGEILKSAYLLGLFPREFDLRQVERVKIIEYNIPGQNEIRINHP